MALSSGLRLSHRTQGNTYINWFIIKDIKNIDEQPDEEVHRAKSGRIPRAGHSAPVELGHLHRVPAHGSVHQRRSSPNLPVEGFLWRLITT